MNKTFYHLVLVALFSGFVAIGCGEDAGLLVPSSDEGIQSLRGIQPLAKETVAPGIEVKPVYRVSTDRPGERLTVFVFYERGGKGKKPPKNGGGGKEECSDSNTNQAFSLLGVQLPASAFPVEYHPAFEPTSVIGTGFGAVDQGFTAWETAVGNTALFSFTENSTGSSPPERDDTNVVGWRLFVGKGGGFLAAAFIWDDGGTILEADIFYNLKHKWAVNNAIEPGSTQCGEQFDIQAIGTHEIGHMLGLGHVSDDGDATNGDETDATMFGSAKKGELKKQTLTPGDETGAKTVAPSLS